MNGSPITVPIIFNKSNLYYLMFLTIFLSSYVRCPRSEILLFYFLDFHFDIFQQKYLFPLVGKFRTFNVSLKPCHNTPLVINNMF